MSKWGRSAVLIVAAVAMFGLGSCTWLLSGFNHIEIDGDRYELSEFAVWYLGGGSGLHGYNLVFTSEDLIYDPIVGADGSGQVVLLTAIYPRPEFEEGTFVYREEPEAFGIGYSAAAVGARFIDDDVVSTDYNVEFDGGQFSIRETLSGDFVIEFDFTGYDYESDREVDVTGRFRGAIDSELDLSSSGSVFDSRSILRLPEAQ